MRRFSCIAIFLVFGFLFVSGRSLCAAQNTHPAYKLMLEAAQRQQAAQREIYLVKRTMGVYHPDSDFNRTGMLGDEYTLVTTTVGVLSAKRSATSPDFAAYVVRMLVDHDVRSGDTVLVNMTGSFPALNVAVCAALDVLNIPSLRFTSLGASSHGANQLELTWIDMEDVLVREGLLEQRSDYVTLGGMEDVMTGIDPQAVTDMEGRCARLGYRLINTGSLHGQIARRWEIYRSARRFALLINVGGNHALLGPDLVGRELPGGWIDPATDDWKTEETKSAEGILFDFLNNGVPVLNLIHVADIAEKHDIPFDPSPLPLVGTSPIYYLETAHPDSL